MDYCPKTGAMNNAATRCQTQPHAFTYERSRPRVRLHVSTEVNCIGMEARSHVGLLRDVSPDGVFFYSDFKPPIGTEVEVTFTIPVNSNRLKFVCRGKVLRVEQTASGAAPGIAARLYSQPVYLPS